MFKSTLPAIMTGITKQFGLKLAFGHSPSTDGRTVFMPEMAIFLNDQKAITKVMGDLVHECGHVKHTDFVLTNKTKKTDLQMGVFNAVEDVRMEKASMVDMRGARNYLAQSYQHMTEDGECRTGEDGPSDALITYCFVYGAITVNQFNGVKQSFETSKNALTSLIGEEGITKLNNLLDQIDGFSLDKFKGTKQSLALAFEIVALMQELAKPESEQDKGEKGKDAPDQGDSEESQDGMENGDNQDSGLSNSGSPGSNEQSDEPNTQAGAQAILDDSADSSEFGNWDKVVKAVVDQAIADGVPTTSSVGEYGDMESGKKGGLGEQSSTFTPNLTQYNQLKAESFAEVAALKRKAIAKLTSMNKSRTRFNEDEGRLDIRAAIRGVISGDTMIRKQVVHTKVPQPAITLLIDASGSMNSSKRMEGAKKSAMALLEVCDAANISVEVIAFESSLHMVKSFDMPSIKARGVIGGLKGVGGTDTATAVYQAGKRLASRKEQRKIMFVITDGVPYSVEDTKSMVELSQRSGIEVIGLGLDTDAINQFCDRYSVVSTDNLCESILSSL